MSPEIMFMLYGMALLAGLLLVFAGVRARLQKRPSGVDAMIGARVIALTALAPQGRVSYGGENWAAILEPPATRVEEGSSVRITAVEGLRLSVQPVFTMKSDVE